MYAADRSSIDQGALLESGLFRESYADSAAIVLTPRCDIAQEKAEFVTLAAVVPPLVILENWGTTGERRNQLAGIMDGRPARWHWLAPHPPFPFPQGAIIDFQLVASVDMDLLADVTVLCVLESPWCEHMASRYAAYASRVGIPDVPKEDTRRVRDDILKAYESLGRAPSDPQ